jgi:hypothetical protein
MSLDSYVQSFEIQAPTGRVVAGTPIKLTAVPTEILDIPRVEVLTAPLNLTILFQHVQLPKAQLPQQPAGLKPWPPQATATSVVTSVTTGLAASIATDAIEGWLGAISGTVPVGTRDISDQIQIEFRWRFTNAETGMQTDIAVVGGALNASSVTVVVPPLVTEATKADFAEALASVTPDHRLGIQLIVRGRVGNVQDTGEILIPPAPLELSIVPIPLPSVAALFRDQELVGDALLLMVPNESLFSSASILVESLSPLKNLLDTVNDAAVATTWATGTRGLLSAVTALAERIPLTKHVGIKVRDDYHDLGKYNFIVVNNWFDTDIEDRGSSALVISATRSISFFEHDDQRGEKLEINAVPARGQLGGAIVRRLHVSVPQSVPPGCVSSSGLPGGGSWGDVISSYRWDGG